MKYKVKISTVQEVEAETPDEARFKFWEYMLDYDDFDVQIEEIKKKEEKNERKNRKHKKG